MKKDPFFAEEKNKNMIKYILESDKNSCLFFHRWKTVFDNKHSRYQECKDCDARRILQNLNGYQSINFKFLTDKYYDFHIYRTIKK